MKFKIEKIANIVFITSDCGTIFRTWNGNDFTERKLKNAVAKITNDLNGNAEFERLF